MTVSTILAGKGREVVSVEPSAASARPSFLAPIVASPALSPNATSCASWRSAELARSTRQ